MTDDEGDAPMIREGAEALAAARGEPVASLRVHADYREWMLLRDLPTGEYMLGIVPKEAS